MQGKEVTICGPDSPWQIVSCIALGLTTNVLGSSLEMEERVFVDADITCVY